MLNNIQILRFLAAFVVVLHHMQPPITPFRFDFFPAFLTQIGFAGVDIFFVISGFIMAQTTRNLPSGFRTATHFLVLRFGRIYIGWWPFFLLFFMSINVRSQIDLLGSFFLWPQDLMQNLLPITWTLSFELYFYLSVAIIVAWNRSHAIFVLFFLAFIIALMNLYFYSHGLYLPENEAHAKVNLMIPFYLSPLSLEFIAGFIASDWLRKKPIQNLSYWLIGAFCFFITSYMYQGYLPQTYSGMAGFFHVCERTFFLGGFALCTVIIAMEFERRKITPFAYLRKLGDASYSIYLSHLVVLIFMGKIYNKHQVTLQLSSTTWGVFSIALIFLISRLYYIYYEKPVNSKLKNISEKIFMPSSKTT